MSNKAIAQRLYDTLNAGRFDQFDEIVAENFIEHEVVPGVAPGRDGVRQLFRQLVNPQILEAASAHQFSPLVRFRREARLRMAASPSMRTPNRAPANGPTPDGHQPMTKDQGLLTTDY